MGKQEYTSVESAVERMNACGKKGEAFLFAFDFELEKAIFVSDPLACKSLLFDIKGRSNVSQSASKQSTPDSGILSAHPAEREHYNKGFARVREGLLNGDSFLCNLTAKTRVDLGVSLEQVFFLSNAKYKLCVPDAFVCFSPECFVSTKDNRIYTFPMKGTIDASLPDAERILMSDKKEEMEHYTIVDLMRNDLNSVCSDVRVEKFRYAERIDTIGGAVLQTSSEISGLLPSDWRERIGSLLVSLLPAGSICGSPKKATVDLIRQAEGCKRGFYSGVFGFFDGRDLDTAVMIRFIEKSDEGFFFRSGGGITIHSDCEKEFDEVEKKIYIPIKRKGDALS